MHVDLFLKVSATMDEFGTGNFFLALLLIENACMPLCQHNKHTNPFKANLEIAKLISFVFEGQPVLCSTRHRMCHIISIGKPKSDRFI